MPYRVRAFGGWGLLDPDGEPTGAVQAHSKGAAVVAYLATRPVEQAVDRADLLPLLWPERTEKDGRRSLRAVLSRLRDRLPDDALGGKGEDRLWLRDTVLSSDVRTFERALARDRQREALRIYRGAFLRHFRLSGVSPFNRWKEERRQHYRRDALQAALTVGEDAHAGGEYDEAECAYRRALDLAPLKEEAAAGLLRALAARGERSDALQFYQAFRDRLDEELDLSPSDELEALAERVRSVPARETRAKTPTRDRTGGAPAAPPDSAAPEGRDPTPRWLSRPPVLATLLLLFVAAGTGLWYGFGANEPERIPTVGADPPTVAVFPFVNIGDHEEARPLLEGLHASLLTRLSNVSGLEVLSRTSVTNFGTGELAPMEIADSLGAEWVVEGETQLVGDEVQVNAQLIDSETNAHAWAASYRRTLTAESLFAIQTEIARRIVGSLEAELTSTEAARVARRPTSDLEAYRLYVRGRGQLIQRTDSSIARAEELFRRAVERDSTFAPAWAALAQALVIYPGRRDNDPDSVFPLGQEAARRALQLDADLAQAHAALSIIDFYRMRLPLALRRIRRAVDIEPSFALGYHGLNLAHLVLGRPEEALEYAQRSVALSPLEPQSQAGLAWAASAVGDHGRALRAARRMRDLEPDYGGPFLEASSLYRMGRLTEGDTAVGRGVKRQLLALEAARSGDPAPALALLDRFRESLDFPIMSIGVLQAALNRREQAIETFRSVFRRQETSGGGGNQASLPLPGRAGSPPERSAVGRVDPRGEHGLGPHAGRGRTRRRGGIGRAACPRRSSLR